MPEDSKAAGLTLLELEQQLEETEAQILCLVHNDVRMNAPNPRRKVWAGDILVIEAEADALASVLSRLGLKLEEAKQPEKPAEFEEPGADEPKNKKQRLKPKDQTANKE